MRGLYGNIFLHHYRTWGQLYKAYEEHQATREPGEKAVSFLAWRRGHGYVPYKQYQTLTARGA